jgi:hypothetical protein
MIIHWMIEKNWATIEEKKLGGDQKQFNFFFNCCINGGN